MHHLQPDDASFVIMSSSFVTVSFTKVTAAKKRRKSKRKEVSHLLFIFWPIHMKDGSYKKGAETSSTYVHDLAQRS